MPANLLLGVLPDHERRRIAPYCERVPLRLRMTLIEPESSVDHVWFPDSGVCSSLIHVSGGEAVEVALVGREGMVGLPLVLGGFANPFHVVVQSAGSATRIAREPFTHEVLDSSRPFCGALLKYANLYLSIVAQTAACNRLHTIEQRLARWLLDMRVRTDSPDLPLTHEFLGLMVGAYRPSVTNALSALEERHLIHAGRGHVLLVDEKGLEAVACECHQAVQRRTMQTLDQIRSMAA
ncbi:MAG TPA: Crp/Fnr family transcriptional regulator [Candidatus Baltobacteraceae bacterium]|jgi:CRP-like cAMP-binding protein|nr:Crp/Fnr family transcriptional regulator [Candidatus Baltobacteraceae bacterium]